MKLPIYSCTTALKPLLKSKTPYPSCSGSNKPLIPVFRGLHHECLEAILRKS